MHHPDEPNVYDAINKPFTGLEQIKRLRSFSVKVEWPVTGFIKN